MFENVARIDQFAIMGVGGGGGGGWLHNLSFMEAGTVDSLGNVYTNYSLLSSILLVFKFVKKSISCRRQSFSQPSESCDTTRADFCGLLY